MLERSAPVEMRDLARGPSLAELQAWLDPHPLEEVLSRRAGVFRERGYDRGIPARTQVYRDILEQVNLLRRPLLLGPREALIVGFHREAYDRLFPASPAAPAPKPSRSP